MPDGSLSLNGVAHHFKAHHAPVMVVVPKFLAGLMGVQHVILAYLADLFRFSHKA